MISDKQVTYELKTSVITAGTTSVPSVIELRIFEVRRGNEKRGVNNPFGMRLQLCNAGTFANSTNGVLAPSTGFGTTRDTHTTSKELTIDSPTVGVQATGTLTIAGVVIDGEKTVIGPQTYTFSNGATTVSSSEVSVDISAGGTKSAGTLTMIDAPTADDTLTLGSTVYTYKASATLPGEIALGGAAVPAVTEMTVVGGSVAQIEVFTCVADVADSLDGTYISLSDEDGTVEVWIDTDDSGTAAPGVLDRAIECTTVVTGDADTVVATAVAGAINGDSKFTAVAAGAIVTVTHATAGAVADGADVDAGFTTFSVSTNGTTHALNQEYFVLQDTAGPVVLWIDQDNSGSTISTTATAAAVGGRTLEITTVTSVMTTNTLATTIAAAINADSQFASTASSAVMTITNAEDGEFGIITAGDTGFTPITETTSGVDATGQDSTVAAINGTDGINTANDEVSIAAFVDNDAVITALYTGVLGDAIITTETFTAAATILDAGTLGTTTAGVDVTATEAGDALDVSILADASSVVTSVNTTGTVVLTAKTVGTAQNAFSTTETMANGSYGAALLTGGVSNNESILRVSVTNTTGSEAMVLRAGMADIGGLAVDYTKTVLLTHEA